MDASLIAQSAKQFRADSAYADAVKTHADKKASAVVNLDKAKKTAQDFEAFFVGQMMEYMTAGLKADGMFGGGYAEDTWRSMLNQEYGKEIAKRGGLGISEMVAKAMLEMQERRTAGEQVLEALDLPSATDEPATGATQNAAAAAGTLARRSVMA